MMRSLLEDRFALRTHVETRSLPVYILTVDGQRAKMPAVPENGCTIPTVSASDSAPPETPFCGRMSVTVKGRTQTVVINGETMDDFASARLSNWLDRPVLDKTGLTGRFDIHLVFAPDGATPGVRAFPGERRPSDAGFPAQTLDEGPSVFTAMRDQLGLKLTPSQGPVQVLIINQVKRPSDN